MSTQSEETRLVKLGWSIMAELLFVKELIIIILALCLLAAYFVTSQEQVFEDCLGPDVPAHCVD